jgi:hypothetical protein
MNFVLEYFLLIVKKNLFAFLVFNLVTDYIFALITFTCQGIK